jgi:ribosome-associated translation inhibitor RaiA
MDVLKASSAPVEDTIAAVENDRELKAHIYQGLVDLQPYLAPESQIAVIVQIECDEDGSNAENVLTLVASLGEFRMECEGRSDDIYEAFDLAKTKMLDQLEAWFADSVDTSERDAQIQSVIEGRHMIH